MELGKIARAKSLPHTKNRGQRLTLTHAAKEHTLHAGSEPDASMK